ncbi:MAG: HD-GYP domain-containing protein [Planctomycetota bacterium]
MLSTLANQSDRDHAATLDRLSEAFGQRFVTVDAARGALEGVTADWPRIDVFRWLPIVEQVGAGNRAEVIEDHAPLVLLATPLGRDADGGRRVAVVVLLTQESPSEAAIDSAAKLFGVEATRLSRWANGRRVWPVHAALGLANATVAASIAERESRRARAHLSDVSAHLIATFDELSLLHQLHEGLSVGRSADDLCREAVARLGKALPSDAVVARLDTGAGAQTHTAGRSPVPGERLGDFFAALGPLEERRSVVLGRDETRSPTWRFPEVRDVVAAPILADSGVIGHIAAINHRRRANDQDGFGSVESSLLSSVATIVGVHAGNRRLYEDRAELFQTAVRALASAIDAKDAYTSGHSDRVARIAVRLARELGASSEELNTIYLGGLLHDIGKIGIDDGVLNKPGKLSDEEFDLVKTHPVVGERILRDVPHLAHVLPIVRHHHESWDGRGYPDGLAGEACPWLARIVAVADAIDAMGSDRPYRKGMPAERYESILREGAGQQWDADVVDAYFAAREDVLRIATIERDPLDLDVSRWADSPRAADRAPTEEDSPSAAAIALGV